MAVLCFALQNHGVYFYFCTNENEAALSVFHMKSLAARKTKHCWFMCCNHIWSMVSWQVGTQCQERVEYHCRAFSMQPVTDVHYTRNVPSWVRIDSLMRWHPSLVVGCFVFILSSMLSRHFMHSPASVTSHVAALSFNVSIVGHRNGLNHLGVQQYMGQRLCLLGLPNC
jgi:hypothetical protein